MLWIGAPLSLKNDLNALACLWARRRRRKKMKREVGGVGRTWEGDLKAEHLQMFDPETDGGRRNPVEAEVVPSEADPLPDPLQYGRCAAVGVWRQLRVF